MKCRPSETITDKRARQAISVFSAAVEKEYPIHFPFASEPAPEEFWTKLEGIEIALKKALKKRPMDAAIMIMLRTKAFQALRNTMIRLAKTVKQPPMHTVGWVDLATGKLDIKRWAYHDEPT